MTFEECDFEVGSVNMVMCYIPATFSYAGLVMEYGKRAGLNQSCGCAKQAGRSERGQWGKGGIRERLGQTIDLNWVRIEGRTSRE